MFSLKLVCEGMKIGAHCICGAWCDSDSVCTCDSTCHNKLCLSLMRMLKWSLRTTYMVELSWCRDSCNICGAPSSCLVVWPLILHWDRLSRDELGLLSLEQEDVEQLNPLRAPNELAWVLWRGVCTMALSSYRYAELSCMWLDHDSMHIIVYFIWGTTCFLLILLVSQKTE